MGDFKTFTSPTSPVTLKVMTGDTNAPEQRTVFIMLDKDSDAGRSIKLDRDQMLELHAQLAQALGFTD